MVPWLEDVAADEFLVARTEPRPPSDRLVQQRLGLADEAQYVVYPVRCVVHGSVAHAGSLSSFGRKGTPVAGCAQ